MIRKLFKHPFAVAVLALFALAATPALHASSACPTPFSTTNAGLDGSSGGEALAGSYLSIINASPATANITCNVLITVAANGSITTTNPNGAGFYDAGGDDNVVGVVNNGTTAITSLHLTSASVDIFGFEQDGICGGYVFAAGSASCGNQQGSNAQDNYFPQGVSFTNIAGNNMSGDVNFLNGGIAPGSTGFFSLEGPVDINLVITPGPTVPEPGTLLMMGTGLAGFAGMVRRKLGK